MYCQPNIYFFFSQYIKKSGINQIRTIITNWTQYTVYTLQETIHFNFIIQLLIQFNK